MTWYTGALIRTVINEAPWRRESPSVSRGHTWVQPCRKQNANEWRHQLETFLHYYTGGFPSQRPVTRNFDIFFDLRLNKWMSKQSRRRWFETPPCSLWRHRNAQSNADKKTIGSLLMLHVTTVYCFANSKLIDENCMTMIFCKITL